MARTQWKEKHFEKRKQQEKKQISPPLHDEQIVWNKRTSAENNNAV
jgi:hypothetical protein